MACVVGVSATAVGVYSYFYGYRPAVVIAAFGVYFSWLFAKEPKRTNDGHEISPWQRRAGPLLTLWVCLLAVVTLLTLYWLVCLWIVT